MFRRLLLSLILASVVFLGGLGVAEKASANTVWLDANTCDYANGWCAVYACSTRALASPVANIQEYFHGYYSSDYRGINDPASAECDRLVFWVDNQTDLIQIVVNCGGINCYSVWVSRYW